MNQACWWVLYSQVYCSTFQDTGDIWNSDGPESMVETVEWWWTGSSVSQLRWYAGPQGERTQCSVELSPEQMYQTVVLVTTDVTPCDCCCVKPHCLQSFGRRGADAWKAASSKVQVSTKVRIASVQCVLQTALALTFLSRSLGPQLWCVWGYQQSKCKTCWYRLPETLVKICLFFKFFRNFIHEKWLYLYCPLLPLLLQLLSCFPTQSQTHVQSLLLFIVIIVTQHTHTILFNQFSIAPMCCIYLELIAW